MSRCSRRQSSQTSLVLRISLLPQAVSKGTLFTCHANKAICLGDANLLASSETSGELSEPQLFHSLASIQDDHWHFGILALQPKHSESCKSSIVQRIVTMPKPINVQRFHITRLDGSITKNFCQTQDAVWTTGHRNNTKLGPAGVLAETQLQGIYITLVAWWPLLIGPWRFCLDLLCHSVFCLTQICGGRC